MRVMHEHHEPHDDVPQSEWHHDTEHQQQPEALLSLVRHECHQRDPQHHANRHEYAVPLILRAARADLTPGGEIHGHMPGRVEDRRVAERLHAFVRATAAALDQQNV
ncbi:MAG: hypothetical protein ACK55I_09270, partial [bacterium]